MRNKEPEAWQVCKKSTAHAIYSRRCFATGEYCSKQAKIHKEREMLHDREKNQDKVSINAFVVMNFSDMSDVAYNWRIQDFIESLRKYLWINPRSHEIGCIGVETDQETAAKALGGEERDAWVPVEKINVIRADTNAVTNHVVCNRICQQLQIADLVVVDVSVVNSNVFYEFGMAAALGKLILPICYSEAFYARDRAIDEKLPGCDAYDALRNHIGRFPWRKKLFEYYGLRCRKDDSHTRYCDFDQATKEEAGFDDRKYIQFPYDEGEADPKAPGEKIKIGRKIYDLLSQSYNLDKTGGKPFSDYNTLVVYTMDTILDREKAGQCIVNYYNNFTRLLRKERCFCGDRVGILGQDNLILDDPKDAKNRRDVLYNVSDIIHIGMNNATYLAQQKKIKTADCLDYRPRPGDGKASWQSTLDIYTQSHINNRCIPIFPDNPIYVRQYTEGIQQGLLDVDALKKDKKLDNEQFFCLFHVMLYTLKYTSQIVVDISRNSLQALFWLGVAHGSDVQAVTVKQVLTDAEREKQTQIRPERNIFDVAGLWTAKLQSGDTKGFYRQLALAQMGIEQGSKLMLEDLDIFERDFGRQLYEPAGDGADHRLAELVDVLERKSRKEKRLLESYYRERFWRHMLRYNELGLYYIAKNDTQPNEEPKLRVAKWDVDAVGELSHYLSKRAVIGEFHQEKPSENEPVKKAARENFISIGSDIRPMISRDGKTAENLAEHIIACMGGKAALQSDPKKRCNILRQRHDRTESGCTGTARTKGSLEFRGFQSVAGQSSWDLYDQFPGSACYSCMKEEHCNTDGENRCTLKGRGNTTYHQLAQLLLWRDVTSESESGDSDVKFRVSLAGVSGPATKALTALLVDDDRKDSILGQADAGTDRLPLNDLQTQIRRIFVGRFDEELGKARNANLERVRYAAKAYLSTMLYQYFLPFLSRADVDRICNGLHVYMIGIDDSYITAEAVQTVEKTLRRVLESFRGVEAIYQVTVQIRGDTSDSRTVLDIRPKEAKDVPVVSGLFVPQSE